MKKILDELNLENGSNYKLSVLKKYQDNELLKRVLKMTLDKVKYTYGITMKNIDYSTWRMDTCTLETALDILENKFCTREYTGNRAVEELTLILSSLTKDDATILERIIGRDLKINVSTSTVNKVWKNLVTEPGYERCDIGTKKNVEKNIDFKELVFSQIKMDGTYRSTILEDDITIMSRSGQEGIFPYIESEAKLIQEVLPDVALLGEFTLKGEQQRSKGNGLIDSLNPPHEEIIYTVWDAVPLSEYKLKNGTSLYCDRLKKLEETLNSLNLKHIQLIEYKIIKSMREAFEHFQEVTQAGGEGTVIKAHDMTWKDGTSKQQLKVKLEIDVEVRITGFSEGTKGTKREKTFGAIEFETDDKKIKGRTSGFSDKLLEDFNSRREELIGQIMTVRCNDITKAKNNDFHALSHPRFVELRNDRTSTETLERALENKEMAMQMKD